MAPSFLVLNTLNTFLLTEKGMKEFILSKALHNPFELYHKKQNHLTTILQVMLTIRLLM